LSQEFEVAETPDESGRHLRPSPADETRSHIQQFVVFAVGVNAEFAR
jgi:hypothetical protein